MKNENRKELAQKYAERTISGGVYCIKNNQNQKVFIVGELDLRGAENRFAFFKSTDTAPHYKLKADWRAYGKDAFSMEILEELTKSEDQSMAQFKADLALLETMWKEKFDPALLY